MSTNHCNNIIIGSEGCSISKVVSLLKASPSFSLFHDNWSYIAVDLDTSRTLTKKLRKDSLLDKVNLGDIVGDLMEEWVGRKGDKATVHELVRILEDNDMNNCAEYLVKGFQINQTKEGEIANKPVNKFRRIPPGLQQFLRGSTKFCVLHTLDNQMTCQKISENVVNSCFLGWKDFMDSISTPATPDSATTEVIVVRGCTLKNLKQLLKLQHIIEGVDKVIYVTCNSEDDVRPFMEKLVDTDCLADTMNLDDLTPAYQSDITAFLEESYGIELLDEIIDGQLLVDLINGITLKLFKDTLPEEPSYYVNRRLQSRHFISLDVFKTKSSDIFLFTGIERYELSKLASGKMTDNSGNQVRQTHITIHNLIQEQPNHFEWICDKTQHPVHLLHYENEGFRWIKSKGKMGEIQNYVVGSNSQAELTEEEFCLKLNTEAVCISDSPGMGKSVLLSRLGRTLEKNYPDRVVLFIVLREFIVHVRNSDTSDIPKGIEYALMSTVCENVVAQAVLKAKLHPQSFSGILIELLLDGFDEMHTTTSKLPLEILQAIRSSFKSVRMWVTSRPHFLNELENNLNILGFNIQPFREGDQLQFLTSFWTDKKFLNAERIRQVASHCLNSLKEKMNSKDRDITGIPLQCLLIGEVFKDEALGYACLGNDSAAISLQIGTVSDLYHRLITKKLDKYKSSYGVEDLDPLVIMEMHARLSLELIFPEKMLTLEHLFPPIQMNEVLKVGIVESSSGTGESHRFIHRTFAEFFIAWFVTGRLRSGTFWEEHLPVFFIDEILRNSDGVFFHSVITYFVDSGIAPHRSHIEEFPSITVLSIQNKSMNEEATFEQIAFACAKSNFVNIFKFFDGIKAFSQHANGILGHDFVLHSIKHSCLELVKLGLSSFEQYHSFDLNMQVQTLHAAVERGLFTNVEYLIKEKGLRNIVEKLVPGTEFLLHTCVRGTKGHPDEEIDQRIQILRMLVDNNRQLLEKWGIYDGTPLLCHSVHIRILVQLIQLGANVCVQNYLGETVLKSTQLSPVDYNTVLTYIPENSLPHLLLLNQTPEDSTLMQIVKNFDPLPHTIATLQKYGEDLNFINSDGYSALAIAVIEGRRTDTLSNLIKYDCNAHWRGRDGATLLHLAARVRNADALEYLLEECQMDPNSEDSQGFSPLTCAITYMSGYKTQQENVFNCGLTLQRHGAKLQDVLYSNGATSLHVASERGLFETARLLLHFKADVNKRDDEGNTPLHIAGKLNIYKSDYIYIIKLLLEHNADPNAKNEDGHTPFHVALTNKDIEFETLLLLKSITDFQWTSLIYHQLWLHLVEKRNDSEVDSTLLYRKCAEHGIEFDTSFKNEYENSLLHLAAYGQFKGAVKYLVTTMGADVNAKNAKKQTALHSAAFGKDHCSGKDIFEYLIDHGADALAIDDQGHTFLHYFLHYHPNEFYFYFDMFLRYLVKTNNVAVLETKGGQIGSTPLQLALMTFVPNQETILLLRSRDVDFNIRDNLGRTVLSYAICKRGNSDFISSLIQLGADCQVLDIHNRSLLHISAQEGDVEHLKCFLQLGTLDVNGQDLDGNTPLHCAALNKYDALAIYNMLIRNGSDANIRNKDGHNPSYCIDMKIIDMGLHNMVA